MKRRKPPHLRRATGRQTCHVCRSMNRTTGLCARYLYAVKKTETCDSWRPR